MAAGTLLVFRVVVSFTPVQHMRYGVSRSHPILTSREALQGK